MTPARILGILLILVLGATLAVGMWGERPRREPSDDDYIAIARSQPEVFRAGVPRQVTVQRGDPVIVEFVFDRERFVVSIDPRRNEVTSVTRR
jgi:hypothetical protein